MQQRDLRLAGSIDLHALGDDGGGAGHGRDAHLVGDETLALGMPRSATSIASLAAMYFVSLSILWPAIGK